MSYKTPVMLTTFGMLALVLAAPVAAADDEIEVDLHQTVDKVFAAGCKYVPTRGVSADTVDGVLGGEAGESVEAIGDDLRDLHAFCQNAY